MLGFDDLGSDEKRPVGPRPGSGAVIHHCSGEADFDGLPGDELASREMVKRKLAEDAIASPAKQAE